MSLTYRLMYRVGFTPWDTGQVPGELAALIDGPGFARFYDRGCFHGLDESQRGAYAAAVDALPALGVPNRIVAGPAGLEQSEPLGRFADRTLASASPDADGELGGPLRNVPRTRYRLVRR
jgi:hypothetical protein